MKNVVVAVASLAALILGGCGNNGNNGQNQNPNAVVPNACGAGVPAGYCTSYNPYTYPTSPYTSTGYGAFGTGYYNNSGYYIPSYSYGTYGCPAGFQPVFNGVTNTCQAVNYLSSLYTGAYSGYGMYYPSTYAWQNGATGYGPGLSCTSGSNTCPGNSVCITPVGTLYGYCSVRTGF